MRLIFLIALPQVELRSVGLNYFYTKVIFGGGRKWMHSYFDYRAEKYRQVYFFPRKRFASFLNYFPPFDLISSTEAMYLKLRNWTETSKLCSLKSSTSSSGVPVRVNSIISNGILVESRSFDLDICKRSQVILTWYTT